MALDFCVLLLLGMSRPIVADFSFLLLHNNDMHSHFQPSDQYMGMCDNDSSTSCYGGFARLHSQVEQLKKQATNKGLPTIFLNAGDSYQGTHFYTILKWPVVARFINMLNIDVMSLGNHEFDDGIAGLVPYIKNVTVPIVTCNLNITEEPSMARPNLTPSYILKVGGTRMGIIGYLTPDTKTISNTEKLQILDEIPSIRAEAKRLLAQNVSILIALGHSGYIMDQEIARQVEDFDLVVGGHSHTFLYSGTPPDVDKPLGPYPTVVTQPSGKQVPVVQAFYGTKYLGYLEVHFDSQGNLKNFSGAPILLSGDMAQDPEILDVLHSYEDIIAEKTNAVVGYSAVLLDNNGMKCKLAECDLGNLITDAYVDYVSQTLDHPRGWTRAAVGLNQAGGIRSSINPQTNVYHNGSVTLGDVMTVIPWGGKIVVLNVTGEVLLQALEFSMARYEDTITEHVCKFLQVSGLHVVYDTSKPRGHRAVSVSVLCADCTVPTYQPLQPSAYYGVAMPEFLSRGGDDFSMFASISDRVVLADSNDYLIVAQYITKNSPVHPKIEGRISILGDTKSSASSLTYSLVLWLVTLFVSQHGFN